jgi:hypothetical protein
MAGRVKRRTGRDTCCRECGRICPPDYYRCPHALDSERCAWTRKEGGCPVCRAFRPKGGKRV